MKDTPMRERQNAINRDLNPHKAARMAMWLWGEDYARTGLGSMGYWDKLSESNKRLCREAVEDILDAPAEV